MQVKDKIFHLLKINKDGLTITETSKKLKIHYTTASKYLAVLEAEGKLKHRDIGMAKLFEINDEGSK
jgi:predicted transcriptional regulator